MSKVSYETFVDYVNELVESGVLKTSKIFGYKKTFRDVLFENGFYRVNGKALYITSVIDNEEYCFTNGKFKRHLESIGMDEKQYISKCGIRLPNGYALTFICNGKNVRSVLLGMNGGERLYFIYRSIMTSVSYDHRKLMLYYGLSKSDAREVERRTHNKQSKGLKGDKNGSFGKRGLSANCFRPFIDSVDPKGDYSEFLRGKNKQMILKWASDNDIDETSFECLKFLYYSMVFRCVHKKKGEEYKTRFRLETVKQGVYMFNREKSLRAYDPRNFLEYNKQLVKLHGSDEDKSAFDKLLEVGEYGKIMSLCFSFKELYYSGRYTYKSRQYGTFRLRSKLEKGFAYIADRLEIVSNIEYENTKIPYNDGSKNRLYYVDFTLILSDGTKVLVEVKPYSQCIIPEGLVLLKKDAAEKYASENGYIYTFVTEKDMKYDLVAKKLRSLQSNRT